MNFQIQMVEMKIGAQVNKIWYRNKTFQSFWRKIHITLLGEASLVDEKIDSRLGVAGPPCETLNLRWANYMQISNE